MEAPATTVFGERFDAIKVRFRLRNSDLARMGGVTDTAIGKITMGKTQNPDVGLLINLVEKLNLNPSWILLGKGNMIADEQSDDSPEYQRKLRVRDEYITELLSELPGKDEGVPFQYDSANFLMDQDLMDDGVGGKMIPLFDRSRKPGSTIQATPLLCGADSATFGR